MTKDKFLAYKKVQDSGLTNMLMIPQVITLARRFTHVSLTKGDCFEIMKHYSEYMKDYFELNPCKECGVKKIHTHE